MFKSISSILLFLTTIEGLKENPWTEKRANILRDKMLYLWENNVAFTSKFDHRYMGDYHDYMYDPKNTTTTKNCVDGVNELCKAWYDEGNRLDDVGFTARKALRLAFHDCIPYKDGSKGCDGCLNLNEDFEDNSGLQMTAAVLEKVFEDPDFPSGAPKLDLGPKNLGMSRADLWAFSGLVALAYYQKHSKKLCDDKLEAKKLMCDDPDPCFTSFPDVSKIFKVGRKDCANTDTKHLYRASKLEHHPNTGFNGQMLVDYFNDTFEFNPREVVALMGAHTVGAFNGVNSKIDYGWVRSHKSKQTEVFNNKYYKVLAARNAKCKEACIGNPMTVNGTAKARWDVNAKLFQKMFKADFKDHSWDNPNSGHPGHLYWHIRYQRVPLCGNVVKDDNAKEDETFFEKEKYQKCCAMKPEDMEQNQDCLRWVQDKIRHISTDVGLYLHWDINDGIPSGCDIFKKKKLTTAEDFATKEYLGNAGCGKQMIKDDQGVPMHQIVENYADNQKEWLDDFFKTFAKMQQSVDNSDDLEQGPSSFWNITDDFACKIPSK